MMRSKLLIRTDLHLHVPRPTYDNCSNYDVFSGDTMATGVDPVSDGVPTCNDALQHSEELLRLIKEKQQPLYEGLSITNVSCTSLGWNNRFPEML